MRQAVDAAGAGTVAELREAAVQAAGETLASLSAVQGLGSEQATTLRQWALDRIWTGVTDPAVSVRDAARRSLEMESG